MDNNEIMVNEEVMEATEIATSGAGKGFKIAAGKGEKNMSETVKNWLIHLYEKEIDESKATISNEHIWELGYNGGEPNPHTNNIRDIQEYISVLEEKIRELQETTEEIATAGSGKVFKVAAGVGLAALGSVIAYKYVVKPIVAKIKAKKEQQEIDGESIDLEDDEFEESDEKQLNRK